MTGNYLTTDVFDEEPVTFTGCTPEVGQGCVNPTKARCAVARETSMTIATKTSGRDACVDLSSMYVYMKAYELLKMWACDDHESKLVHRCKRRPLERSFPNP